MSADAEQEFTTEVAASQSDCFDAIMEFEAYPRWSSAIQEATVLEADRAGYGRIVEFFIDMRFKRVRYVLEYSYEKPSRLTWRSVDGDIESVEGAYTFRKRGPQVTEVTCRQVIVLGFWVPGPLRRLAERTALKQSVLEFKEEAERLVAERAARPQRKGGTRKQKS
jgi:uncharacterized membrane protein